jgi:BirA family biotin operon repressor/biotin-[acetyl-CoA-carboxylase] ligase
LVFKTNIHQIGETFIELSSTDSTNNYAFNLIQEKLAVQGMAIFAHEQTNGKAQRGKTWISEKGANIILSVVLQPSFLQLHQQFYLSAAMALAGYDFLKKYVPENIFIKWPNDLYWNDKKASGILIETKVGKHSAGIPWAVAGFGININQTKFSASLKNPVSLKQITGLNFKPVDLAKELCVCIEKRFSQLQKGKLKLLLKEFNKHLYKLNEEVKLKQKNIVFKCTIKGVDETGRLLVDNAANESYAWGEVEWVV